MPFSLWQMLPRMSEHDVRACAWACRSNILYKEERKKIVLKNIKKENASIADNANSFKINKDI